MVIFEIWGEKGKLAERIDGQILTLKKGQEYFASHRLVTLRSNLGKIVWFLGEVPILPVFNCELGK